MQNGFCSPTLAPWLVGIAFLAASISATAEPPSKSAADGQKTLTELLRELSQNADEVPKARAALTAATTLEARITTDLEQARKADELSKKAQEQQPYSVISKNFVVAAVGRSFSEAVLAKAESLRKEFAVDWLGQELSSGQEFTLIQVELSDRADEGLTLLCGPGRRLRGDHRMWLTTSRERALGSTLAHEVAHVTLNARFPKGMPAWANEGIASQFDDGDRAATRTRIVANFATSNQWPSVRTILDAESIGHTDESTYTISSSLVQFFLANGSRTTLVDFVEAGAKLGWDAALQQFYGIKSVAELQKEWQTWAAPALQKR